MAWFINPTNPVIDENSGTISFSIYRDTAGFQETIYVSTWQNWNGNGVYNIGDYSGSDTSPLTYTTSEFTKNDIITIPILNDSIVEPDETFGLVIQNSSGAWLASTSFTIRNDDSNQPQYADLSVSNISLDNNIIDQGGDTTIRFTVSNQGDADTPVSAVQGIYISTKSFFDGTATLLDQDTAGIVSIGEVDTNELELLEGLSGYAPGTYYLYVKADYNSNILESNENNNISGPVQITIQQQSKADLVTTINSISSTSLDVGEEVTVTYTITNQGQAAAGNSLALIYFSPDQDFTDNDNIAFNPVSIPSTGTLGIGQSVTLTQTAVLPNAVSSGTWYVGVQADALNPRIDEISESNNWSSATQITVIAPPPVVTLSSSVTQASEGGQPLIFNVNLDRFSSSDITVSFQLSGTASNTDYQVRSGDDVLTGSVIILAGQSSASISIYPLADTIVEGVENVGIALTGVTGGNAALGSTLSSSGNITDTSSPSTYSITPVSQNVGEGDGSVDVTVTRTNSVHEETVYVSTVQSEGTANRGDYGGLNTVAYTFAAGVGAINISIDLVDDLNPENNETFAIWVQENQNDPYGTYADRSTFTIIDDDSGASSTTYSLTANQSSVIENDTTVTFTITRSGGSLPAGTVYYSTLFGSASSTFDNDYDGAVNQPVSFVAGSNTATFTIDINEDATFENDETFDVMIALDADDGRADALAISTITIVNDDASTGTPPPVASSGSGSSSAINLGAIGSGTNVLYHDPTAAGNDGSLQITTTTDVTVTTWYAGQPNSTNTATLSPTNGVAQIDVAVAGSAQPVIIGINSIVNDPNNAINDYAIDIANIIISNSFDGVQILEKIKALSSVLETYPGNIPDHVWKGLFEGIDNHLDKTLGPIGNLIDLTSAVVNITRAQDPFCRLYAEVMDFTFARLSEAGGTWAGAALGFFAGAGLGAVAGGLGGGIIGGFLYNFDIVGASLSDRVIERYETIWIESEITSSSSLNQVIRYNSIAQEPLDLTNFVLDEDYYANAHPEAVAAVLSGEASSLFAYFIKWGIPAGHLANSLAGPVDPAFLTIDLDTFDPTAFGSPAIYTAAPGSFAGDQLSAEEQALASHINDQRSPGQTMVVDDELSTLANRIARDWMSNNPTNAMVAQDGGDPTQWAQALSNGEDFRVALANLNWSNLNLDASVRIAGIVSNASTPAQVYALFAATSAGAALLNDNANRSIGIGEYAGLWIITFDDVTYQNDATVSSTPVQVHQFGSENAEIIFAGTGIANAELGDGADTFFGGRHNDVAYGQNGNDTLFGYGGNDHLDGGNGIDTISGGSGRDTVHGGADDDTINGGSTADTLYGDAGIDTIYGDNGADIIYGGTENDRLYGNAYNDSLYGEDGDDDLFGGGGRDHLEGGKGLDELFGGAGVDELHGGADNDDLYGNGSNDTLYGDAGDDNLFGGSGIDIIYGGSGIDHLEGGGGADNLYGGTGVDTIFGNSGNDRLEGGSNIDYLYGGGDHDVIYGNAGADELQGNSGNDFLYGGSGIDLIYGNNGADTIFGGSQADTIYAGSGLDTIDGGSGIDTVYGHGGNDIIKGGADGDFLFGNIGADRITGGAGNDTMTGGDNTDTFIYLTGAFDNDTITDFFDVNGGNDDLIDFSGSANINGLGDLTITFGADALITTVDGTITLTGITGGLDATDFIF